MALELQIEVCMKISAYELLEIEESASSQDIRKAYRRKAQIYHPDHGGLVEDFLNLQKAYEILLSTDRDVLGTSKVFKRMSFRVQPSQNSSLDQLMKNLDVLSERIKKTS